MAAYSRLSAEYSNIIRPKIRNYMSMAVGYMETELKEYITQKAWDNVYSYPATPRAMRSRRYALLSTDDAYLEGHYEEDADRTTLIITNKTWLQDGYTPNEVDIVEQGTTHRQPGPRPFMEEGLKAYVSSRKPYATLRSAMQAAGFDVT